jgi:hypothetical protein
VTAKRPKPLVVQVMERSKARGTMRLVLAGYAWYGDPDGTGIFPSAEGVAKHAGVTVSTVERYRPRLIELGELVVVARDAHGEHVQYAIRLPGQNRASADPVAQDPQQNPQAADSGDNARGGGHDPENPVDPGGIPPRDQRGKVLKLRSRRRRYDEAVRRG